ncbi:MAG: hypothetical protein PHU85_19315 [Phycisphaerae bacterium]|nr:hypothetical protein [Phycisphaerae bacterium]
MGTEAEHLKRAQKNGRAIEYLLLKLGDHPEWVATIAFYKALHLVDALLYHEFQAHGGNHDNRDRQIKTNHRYSHIAKFYGQLLRASLLARYLDDPRVAFEDVFPPEKVKSEILDHMLSQLEHSVSTFLSQSPKPSTAARK